MKVLGVCADPFLLGLMAEYFEERKHEFLGCDNQLDALPLLKTQHPEVVVLDYHLGRGSGRLLAGKILVDFPSVTLVVTVDQDPPSLHEDLRSLGVERLVVKPYRFGHILAAIEDSQAEIQAKTDDAVRLTRYTAVDPAEMAALQSVLIQRPGDENARWLLAFSYYRSSNFRDAASLFEQILTKSPDNILAYYYLGACQYRFGRFEEAKKAWRKVVRLDAIGPLAAKVKARIGELETVDGS